MNENLTLLSLTARTATTQTINVKNIDHNGVNVIIDVTAIISAPSVVPKIQGYDEASSKWYDILVGAAITAVGTTILKVFPSCVVTANLSANDMLPRNWRVLMTHANSNSISYSVGANVS